MTGLSSDQVDRLVLNVYATGSLDPTRRRVVGPYRAVLIVLLYLRHNLSQALIAELFGCSQPTVSRLVGRLMPIITEVLSPTADATAERELRSTVRVDSFLAVTGNWRRNTYTSGMYSGKRHACGFNVQVAGSHHGTLVLTSKPMPGSMHDAKAWLESGLAQRFHGRLHADGGPGGFADTPYTGTGLCVPDRKPKGENLTASARDFNRMIASHRASIERVIAHLQNWRLLATGYRGLLHRFDVFLDTITKLEIYRIS